MGICGDFNARTGKLPDYILTSGDDTIDAITFATSSEFPQYNRFSDDSKSNRYGKDLFDLCKSSNMRIMNGYFNKDNSTGSFTCYTPCGKSLIDYLICDALFHQNLQNLDLEPLITSLWYSLLQER